MTNTVLERSLVRLVCLFGLLLSVAGHGADDLKLSCVGTPTGTLLDNISKNPALYHAPDGVDLKKAEILHHPPHGGKRSAEWKEATYTKDAVTAELMVHAAVEVKGKLLYVEVESAVGGRVAVEVKARVWSKAELMRFPDNGSPLLDKTGLKTVSTKSNPIYFQCTVGADILKDDGKGLIGRSKVDGGFHVPHVGKAGVSLEVETENMKGTERERSCHADTFWLKLPPGEYTSLFGREVCREFMSIVQNSVIEDRARLTQGDLAYLSKQSNCATDNDCRSGVDVAKEVSRAIGPRPNLPIPNTFLPDRDAKFRPKILEGRDTYDLASGHLLGEGKIVPGRAYPACLPQRNAELGITQFRCGVGLAEGAVCFRNSATSESKSVSNSMEQVHSNFVGGLRWDFPCGRGLLCYGGRCRSPETVRTLLYYNKDVPADVRTALYRAQDLKQLEKAVDLVPAHVTPEFRALDKAKSELTTRRQEFFEDFAKKNRPYAGGLADPAARLKTDFHNMEKLFTGKSKGGTGLLDLTPKEANTDGGRPVDLDRYLLKGSRMDRTQLENILDSIAYPFLRPTLLDFDFKSK